MERQSREHEGPRGWWRIPTVAAALVVTLTAGAVATWAAHGPMAAPPPLRDAESTHAIHAAADAATPAPDAAPAAPARGSRWSDPATWGGTVPAAGARVTVPAGKTVILDAEVEVGHLTVNGTLACPTGRTGPLAITARSVMVHGTFACGSPEQPFTGSLAVTLTGEPSDPDVAGMGNKVLGVMGAGTLSLHGAERTSWLRLGATAARGDTTITLDREPGGWARGDRIAIATSSEDMDHTEVRTVTAVDGATLTLDAPLEHGHHGETLSYRNERGATWTVETRAEVGLLSRAIRIEGDIGSERTRHGGHVMTMKGSKAYVSGVGFLRMGQEGVLGRYPFHWHLVGDASGQYVRDSSIERSYNRCVTVHQTDHAVVQDNVCYDHVGHGYFLEDGVEQDNQIVGNLGMTTRKPRPGKAVLDSDGHVGTASEGPGTFWISNPSNTVRGNVAAGGEGTGLWFFMVDEELKRHDGTTTRPRTDTAGEVNGNLAHGVTMGYSSCSFGGVDGWRSKDIVLDDLTVYMTRNTGVWPCALGTQTFRGLKVLDSSTVAGNKQAAFVAPNRNVITDSLFVANSPLAQLNGGRKARPALGLYDNGSGLHRTHFVGYTAEDASPLLRNLGGAVKNTSNHMVDVTFEPRRFLPYAAGTEDDDAGSIPIMSGMHDDAKGSLTGIPNGYLAPPSSILDFPACSEDFASKEPEAAGTACAMRIVKTRFKNVDAEVRATHRLFRRDANGRYTFKDERSNPKIPALQTFSTANEDFYFGVEFTTAPRKDFTISYEDGHGGDRLRHEVRGVPNGIAADGLRRVGSLKELESAKDDVFYTAGGSIHLAFSLPDAADFRAGRTIAFTL
ncbi:MAG: G8 domain-containing protein [Dermatophilaceae bacterium]